MESVNGSVSKSVSKRGPGLIVRVDIELERIVRALSNELGYEPYTIRNLALLLGLYELARAKAMSRNKLLAFNDELFWKLLNEVRELLGEPGKT